MSKLTEKYIYNEVEYLLVSTHARRISYGLGMTELYDIMQAIAG